MSDSDSDSSSSSSDNEETTPKVVQAKVEESDSDSSSDSEEEKEVKAAPAAKEESDSDSSDSEEEEKPKVVPVPAKEDSSDSDSSSDEDEEPKKVVPVQKEESDSDSSDSESEEKEKPKAAPAAKKANDSDSDSDSSDSEDEPLASKAPVATKADDSSDSDSSDDEEEAPKPTAAADSDSDSDSSEDEKSASKPEVSAPEEEKPADFQPVEREGKYTVLFEWNTKGSVESMEKSSKKRRLETPSAPVAKKPFKAVTEEKPAAAAAATTSSKSMEITKDYFADDYRNSQLKGKTNVVFVKGISTNVYEKDITEFFTEHVVKPQSVRHKYEENRAGLAWVTFSSPAEADKAVIDCNNEYIKDRYVNTDWAEERKNNKGGGFGSGPKNAHLKGTTSRIWVGNLHREVVEETLVELFKDKGAPTDVYIIGRDETRPQIAYVSFETNEIATDVVESLQGTSVMDYNIRLDWAEPRHDSGGGNRGTKRKQELSEKPDGCVTCFVGRLSDSVTDELLEELFKDAGTIENIRYMERDGEFKGVAFVQFSESASTDKAVQLNGNTFLGKQIRVDFAADRKKQNRAPDWDCPACGATGCFGSKPTCFQCGEPNPGMK